MLTIKEVNAKEMELVVKNKVVYNSKKGFVDKKGYPVGFYRTKNKRYIEDKYVDIAKKLS